MITVNKAREIIIKKILDVLKEGEIPFSGHWISPHRSFNATTNKEYRGINQFILSFVAAEKRLKDPRWCTYNQAKKNKWQVRNGSKGTPVEFWSLYDIVQKRKISITEANELISKDEKYEKNIRTVSNVFTVFNAQDIEGIPPYTKNSGIENVKDFKQYLSFQLLHNYLENEKIYLVHDGGNRAYYKTSNDSIHLPEEKDFKSEYDYISVLAHEICHSTGNKNRLNRDIKNLFGTEKYAIEELRAEIGSSFLCAELGMQYTEHDIQNHKAYIQSWIQLIEEAPLELFRAINDSQEISDFVLERGNYVLVKEQVQNITVTTEMGIKDRIYLALQETKKEIKPKEKELFSGENLSGAGMYFEDLQVALATGKDLDGVDIPNDTPEERNAGLNKYDEQSR